ncbi:MAG: helix-turn-helix domain-containing protein [Chloroflexota bacterium]
MTEHFDSTEWITTAEAAELTGYDPAHVRWLIRKGRVNGKKFGRDWMIDRGGLLEYKRRMDDLGTEKHDPWRTGARQSD